MSDETGIILPYEKEAMSGLEMPDGLSYPDQCEKAKKHLIILNNCVISKYDMERRC